MTIDAPNEPTIVIQTVAKTIDGAIALMANHVGDPEIGIDTAVDGIMEVTAIIIRSERAAGIGIRDSWIEWWFAQASVHKSLWERALAMEM